MQQVIGVLLIALGLFFGALDVLVVLLVWGTRRSQHTNLSLLTFPHADRPELILSAAQLAAATPRQPGRPDPSAYFDKLLDLFVVSGVVDSPATLQAPLSARPCVAWNVTIYHWLKAENRYDRQPIWLSTQVGQLAIAYRRTRFGRARPVASGGMISPRGTATVAQGYIFPHRSQLAPISQSYLERLPQAELPGEVRAEIAAHPDEYGVTEQYLTTGDVITSGRQQMSQFTIGPGYEVRGPNSCGTCLSIFLLAVTGVLMLIGYGLLTQPLAPQ